jgi:hypothetical protein
VLFAAKALIHLKAVMRAARVSGQFQAGVAASPLRILADFPSFAIWLNGIVRQHAEYASVCRPEILF